MDTVLRAASEYIPDLLDLNVTVSFVILFVICVRKLMNCAPKIFSYVLWGIVLLRLLVPVSIESPMSFLPERRETSGIVEINDVLPEIRFDTAQDRVDTEYHMEAAPSGDTIVYVSKSINAETYLALIWVGGMAVMLLRGGISYGKLRHRVSVSVPFQKGIYIADDIDTPFVMGVFRPVIYLPGTLEASERKYIIAHERHHIRRGDHIFKALGYLALTIHWFNPFVWVAFVLTSRDMEMSCDEAVIRKLGEDVRAEYASSLLNLATGHRLFAGTPLAFGEGNPTERVRNLARWKKPALWVTVVCVLVCILLVVCLLTDPSTQSDLQDLTRTSGPASVGIGEFAFSIPEDYSIVANETDDDGASLTHIIRKFDMVVGGVYILNTTDRSQYDMWEWINSLNIPEKVPEERMLISVDYVELRSDVTYSYAAYYGRKGTVETIHYLYPSETVVYDIWFDMTLLTESDISSILDSTCINADNSKEQTVDWGISIAPDRVSRTGATALFVYSGNIPGEDVAELNYGDFLSLDRLVDGSWVPCDELAGYEYFVGDASYPVVNGYGMVHDWDNRFGELADGHYRLGKQVTLVRPDGSRENRIVYGEFSIPDSILTGPIPLEDLPELYGAEQAMIDGCLVSRNGDAMDNLDAFREFYQACYRGESGFFRTVDYIYGEEFYFVVYDIRFDGSKYTLDLMDSRDRWIRSAEFRHLKCFTGEDHIVNAAYECYTLVDDNNIKWDELQFSRHRQVFADYIYYPKTPQLPENPGEAILEFDGQLLISTTDFDRLEKIWILFEEAEFLGYEPKTHSVEVGLNLVLKSQSGETMTIELDPDSDICRINGEFVFYGAYDEPDYIEKLWYYLGIEAWPDVVYDTCENAYRP